MPTLEQARDLILQDCRPLGAETVGPVDALGRVLFEDVVSACDLPRWDNSAMDGYALRAEGSRPGQWLPVRGFLPAGGASLAEVEPGTAARILTGAAIPPGADCVVPFEAVEVAGDSVRLTSRPTAGDHVRSRGSDVRRGEVVLPAGTVIGHPEIAVFAALGHDAVVVGRRPRVAILSTGDELVPVGGTLRPGSIFDSNGPALAAAVTEAGAIPSLLGIARDDPEALRTLLREGLRADALVISAGASTGDRDLVRQTLRELGAEERFWRVDIQPGRPMAFAVAGECPVFCLPGNPVAALLTFALLARPALRRLLGHRRPIEATRRGVLGEDVSPRADRTTLRRVRLGHSDGQLTAWACGPQATGHLRTLSRADGVALVPAGTSLLPAGTWVDIHPLRPDTEFHGADDE